MKKLLLSFLTGLLFCLDSASVPSGASVVRDSINDGPYFFFVDTDMKVRWLENNTIKEYFITQGNFNEIKDRFKLLFSFRDLYRTRDITPAYKQTFKSVDSIAVITDVHGEYHTYIKLLRAMGIIDKDLNWNFGNGHLVVLGDVFDRGNMVTEVLWHLFGLEKQAAKAGGMVHVLLGNHELLTLINNQDFINKKYTEEEAIFGTDYSDLYSENSVMGKWIRSMPVVITIDDILFVHAGISKEIIDQRLKIKQINRLFSAFIIGKDPATFAGYRKLKFLSETKGPLWYRGYFADPDFTESALDSILNFYGKAHIVVGHTPDYSIRALYNNKIFGADAGIGNKLPGQMLIYKNGSFYIGYSSGKRKKL